MQKNKQIPIIKTGRLIIRPFVIEDAAEVQRLAGDRVIADTTLSIPHPYPDGGAEEWIFGHVDSFNKGLGVTFAVTRSSDGALVGAISLMNMAAGHQAELGYWTGRPYWNQGYCMEAGRVVLGYAFTKLELTRVHACHLTLNPASGRVMQKLSLRHEGCRRQHVKKWGRCEDLELYRILKHEWVNMPIKDRLS